MNDNKPVMGTASPRTKKAVEEAWEMLPTNDHRLGYMISFAQGLEEELEKFRSALATECGKHLRDLSLAPEERRIDINDLPRYDIMAHTEGHDEDVSAYWAADYSASGDWVKWADLRELFEPQGER